MLPMRRADPPGPEGPRGVTPAPSLTGGFLSADTRSRLAAATRRAAGLRQGLRPVGWQTAQVVSVKFEMPEWWLVMDELEWQRAQE